MNAKQAVHDDGALDMPRLAAAMIARRGERTLREVEVETGISRSTLSRIENGMVCDLRSFAAAIRWTGEDAYVILGLDPREPR